MDRWHKGRTRNDGMMGRIKEGRKKGSKEGRKEGRMDGRWTDGTKEGR
jgi:flagellar biosynthesis/type III secretory pathway protein FliH